MHIRGMILKILHIFYEFLFLYEREARVLLVSMLFSFCLVFHA